MLLNRKCTYFPASLQGFQKRHVQAAVWHVSMLNNYVPLPPVMKRILLLSDINSAHTKKWAGVLVTHGLAVGIYSLSKPADDWYREAGIELLSESGFANNTFDAATAGKISYLRKRKEVRKTIAAFKPDILHAHYASSYGLLGAMTGFHPYFISVWGSDVLLFPNNPVSKAILRYNFRQADKIIVSSKTLDTAVRRYTRKSPHIIPFGIDTELFSRKERMCGDTMNIGTVKTLRHVYGIDLLIRAFAQVVHTLPTQNISLTIVGDGPEKENLIQLAESLGVLNKIHFMAPVSQTELVEVLHTFDIAVFLSRSESFGVAVLEASSTGLPVVVSKTGGLTEVVDDGITGFHVQPENIGDAAEKILQLLQDESLRQRMGKAGRDKVIREYKLQDTLISICQLYQEDLNS